jgi:hypothetical protein
VDCALLSELYAGDFHLSDDFDSQILIISEAVSFRENDPCIVSLARKRVLKFYLNEPEGLLTGYSKFFNIGNRGPNNCWRPAICITLAKRRAQINDIDSAVLVTVSDLTAMLGGLWYHCFVVLTGVAFSALRVNPSFKLDHRKRPALCATFHRGSGPSSAVERSGENDTFGAWVKWWSVAGEVAPASQPL